MPPTCPTSLSLSLSLLHILPFPLPSPHVHFPPTPVLTKTGTTHSSSAYDRKPIVVLPNECELPERDERRVYGVGTPRHERQGYFDRPGSFSGAKPQQPHRRGKRLDGPYSEPNSELDSAESDSAESGSAESDSAESDSAESEPNPNPNPGPGPGPGSGSGSGSGSDPQLAEPVAPVVGGVVVVDPIPPRDTQVQNRRRKRDRGRAAVVSFDCCSPRAYYSRSRSRSSESESKERRVREMEMERVTERDSGGVPWSAPLKGDAWLEEGCLGGF